MSQIALIIPNLGESFWILLLFQFYNQNKDRRYKPVDVSLQIVKLSEGLSERKALQDEICQYI